MILQEIDSLELLLQVLSVWLFQMDHLSSETSVPEDRLLPFLHIFHIFLYPQHSVQLLLKSYLLLLILH